ncbi:MAG TPA: CpsB/CapC family capsule biosynthesis tyrosine phosphatase [Gaiellaceae bacterium]|nr:CpsB/CapC family capsule biosynthesis tyrosine phosphatase [Gaiellaceae bacterium]
MSGGFVDVHSHVVPSGDDGARSREAGLGLCLDAARHGTRVLYATPHVWPTLPLTPEREESVRALHARMAAELADHGLELRLGWELTPSERLLEEDPCRYRLGGLQAVLMEVPFNGPLALAERLGEHIAASGLTPVVAHPERAEGVRADPGAIARLRERGWLLQVNASSLLGAHGHEQEEAGWRLVRAGHADLVASDGHRSSRPPFLDEAHRLARARVGEAADALFDGSALGAAALVDGDGLDLAQRGEA